MLLRVLPSDFVLFSPLVLGEKLVEKKKTLGILRQRTSHLEGLHASNTWLLPRHLSSLRPARSCQPGSEKKSIFISSFSQSICTAQLQGWTLKIEVFCVMWLGGKPLAS